MLELLIMLGIVSIVIGGGLVIKKWAKGKRTFTTGAGAAVLSVLGYLDQLPYAELLEGREAWLVSAGVGIIVTAFVGLKSTEH